MDETLTIHAGDPHFGRTPLKNRGPFQLLENVGQGGCGEVYRAYDTIFAVKLLLPRAASQADQEKENSAAPSPTTSPAQPLPAASTTFPKRRSRPMPGMSPAFRKPAGRPAPPRANARREPGLSCDRDDARVAAGRPATAVKTWAVNLGLATLFRLRGQCVWSDRAPAGV